MEIEAEKELIALAEKSNEKQLVGILDNLIIAQGRMKLVDIPQLPLEMAIVELTSSSDEYLLGDRLMVGQRTLNPLISVRILVSSFAGNFKN